MIVIAGLVGAVAMVANTQEDSPVLWGLVTLACCVVGGMLGGFFGQLAGGAVGLGLLQLKLAKFG